MMTKVRLLCIGINHYLATDIDDLEACAGDVEKLQQALLSLDLVEKDNCITLIDGQATRSQIIANFRDHFLTMPEDGIAVLYFSGHGSSTAASTELIHQGMESDLSNIESIVCHDSDINGVYDLADKELRWLIAELQDKKPDSKFVGIFDCCHSGSMLRDGTYRIKRPMRYRKVRPYASFLFNDAENIGRFDKMQSRSAIDYLSLTACTAQESAWEDDDGGVFTNALVKLLYNKNGIITYADIHAFCHLHILTKDEYKQTPNLEFTEKANPFTYFLQSETTIPMALPRIQHIEDKPILMAGAIHGLDFKLHLNRTYPISTQKDKELPLSTTKITEIQMETSVLSIEGHLEFEPDTVYYLNIALQKLPISIQISDSQSKAQKFLSYFESESFQQHFDVYVHAHHSLEVSHNKLLLYRQTEHLKELIFGIRNYDRMPVNRLHHHLLMIAKWEQLLQLSSQSFALHPQDIDLSFAYRYSKSEWIRSSDVTAQHALQYVDISIPKDCKGVFYQVNVTHRYHSTDGLYFYLIHLDRTYQIKQKIEDPGKPLQKNIAKVLYNSELDGVGLGIDDSKSSHVEDHFLLIAATSPMVYASYFEQAGIGSMFGKVVDYMNYEPLRGDGKYRWTKLPSWGVKRLTVRLVKKK